MRNMPIKTVNSRLRRLEQQITQVIILVSVLWFLVSNCLAAPCYGTRMPSKNKVFMGLQTHSVFKRHLENESGKVRSTQHILLLSYGLFDWLSIDLKGGAGNIKQRPANSDEIDYTSNFAGGYGFRLKIYEKGGTKAVFGFQHISVHPKSTHLGNVKHQAILDDWQFSLLASRDLLKIIPYLGVRWSRLDYIHWQAGERKRVISDLTESAGLVAGLDIPLAKNAWFNLEGQAFDGEAVALSVNYSF